MSQYVVRPLSSDSWDGFAGLAERHNGVFGGCWCTWFPTMSAEKERAYELPNIYHRKQYLEELDILPDYRVTCIFVDKRYRRRGMSAVALQGAVDLIAAGEGGVVEGYPHDTGGQRKSVLYNGTRELFERAGFAYVRAKGTGHCVMRRTVPPAGLAQPWLPKAEDRDSVHRPNG